MNEKANQEALPPKELSHDSTLEEMVDFGFSCAAIVAIGDLLKGLDD